MRRQDSLPTGGSPDALWRFWDRLRRLKQRTARRLGRVDDQVVELSPRSGAARRGRVLFSFIIDPILAQQRRRPPEDLTHTHFWESWRMTEILREAGWEVHATSWTNDNFTPAASYDVAIDVRTQMQRWLPHLDEGTLRIAHLDTAHWEFNNAAEIARLRALEQRRGTRLQARRQIPPNELIESAHRATFLGNAFTRETYAFAERPMCRIPVSVPRQYDWQERDWEAARRRFLWFGSGGLVHKGLDLVLETFSQLEDLELYVCGPIHREPDFEREYRDELYGAKNIHTLGWIDVSSQGFLNLVGSCAALVYPSCSEGGGSSALTCMHAGLVAMLTREASVDLSSDRTIELTDLSIEALRRKVTELAADAPSDLRDRARCGWEWVRSQHSKEHFEEQYRQFVDSL